MTESTGEQRALVRATAESSGGPLMEASLARIHQRHEGGAFVILTAWRGARELATNQEALRALQRQIRADGYGYVVLEGVGLERRGGALAEAREASLLVPEREQGGGDGSLLSRALGWARAPGGDTEAAQGSLFHADGAGRGAIYEVSSGSAQERFEPFRPEALGRFYARLRDGRTFEYEWAGIKYASPPSSWIEGMGRESRGEIFFFCEDLPTFRAALRG